MTLHFLIGYYTFSAIYGMISLHFSIKSFRKKWNEMVNENEMLFMIVSAAKDYFKTDPRGQKVAKMVTSPINYPLFAIIFLSVCWVFPIAGISTLVKKAIGYKSKLDREIEAKVAEEKRLQEKRKKWVEEHQSQPTEDCPIKMVLPEEKIEGPPSADTD